jgi:hypothetical protein
MFGYFRQYRLIVAWFSGSDNARFRLHHMAVGGGGYYG